LAIGSLPFGVVNVRAKVAGVFVAEQNQAAALAAAQAALQGLLAEAPPRSISRRDLLRGTIGNGKR